MIVVVLLVFWKGTVFGWKNASDILESKYKNQDRIQVTGQVYKTEAKQYYQFIYLQCEDMRYLIKDNTFLSISIGNTIQVTGTLTFFEEARNPGNFNPKLYYDKQKIAASITAESIQITNYEVNIIPQTLQQIRQQGIKRVYQFMEPKQAAMMVAILFGEKNDLDVQDKELYQKVGISHIFAISGVHISILSLIIYQLLRRSTGSFQIAGIMGALLLSAYIVLTGTSTSALRAGIMFGIRIVADITGRVYDLRTAVAVAAMLILMGEPQLLWDGGFLLSFGAIVGVIYLAKPCQELWKSISISSATTQPLQISAGRVGNTLGKIGENIWKGMAVSLAIQLVLYPIMLQFFYETSPYAIFLNAIILPLMNPLLLCAILGIFVSIPFPSLGGSMLVLCEYILKGMDCLCRRVIILPQSRMVVGMPWWVLVVLYYVILIVLCYRMHVLCHQTQCNMRNLQSSGSSGRYGPENRRIRRVINRRYRRYLLVLCILPLIFLLPRPRPSLQVTMLDIGQGNSLFVRGPSGGTYLMDSGSTTVTEVAKYRIEPYLKSQGVSQIDYAFVSHGDQDHINGIIEMLQRKQVGIPIRYLVICKMQLADPVIVELVELADAVGTQVITMQPGECITEKSLRITYLLPREEEVFNTGNESSMILDICMGEFRMLSTGDMEGIGEENLISVLQDQIQQGHSVQYTVYQVAHHGSQKSSTDELLQLIQPKLALISAGEDNSYGHPHASVLERLEKRGIKVFRTDQSGGVTIYYNEKVNQIKLEKTIGVKE